jgi:hypothetical protein
MAKLTPAHMGQFVAICATRNEATPRVNAAGGSDEVKRAGGSGIFSHAGSIPQSSLTARLFLFFFFSCNLLSINELRARAGALVVTL